MPGPKAAAYERFRERLIALEEAIEIYEHQFMPLIQKYYSGGTDTKWYKTGEELRKLAKAERDTEIQLRLAAIEESEELAKQAKPTGIKVRF
jgi:hypothetical protein